MRSPPLLLLISTAALMVSPALAHAASPARCDGKHRRPANPYGSVLATGLKPEVLAAPAPAAGSPSAAAAAVAASPAKPVAVSRAELRASLAPCGGAA